MPLRAKSEPEAEGKVRNISNTKPVFKILIFSSLWIFCFNFYFLNIVLRYYSSLFKKKKSYYDSWSLLIFWSLPYMLHLKPVPHLPYLVPAPDEGVCTWRTVFLKIEHFPWKSVFLASLVKTGKSGNIGLTFSYGKKCPYLSWGCLYSGVNVGLFSAYFPPPHSPPQTSWPMQVLPDPCRIWVEPSGA